MASHVGSLRGGVSPRCRLFQRVRGLALTDLQREGAWGCQAGAYRPVTQASRWGAELGGADGGTWESAPGVSVVLKARPERLPRLGNRATCRPKSDTRRRSGVECIGFGRGRLPGGCQQDGPFRPYESEEVQSRKEAMKAKKPRKHWANGGFTGEEDGASGRDCSASISSNLLQTNALALDC